MLTQILSIVFFVDKNYFKKVSLLSKIKLIQNERLTLFTNYPSKNDNQFLCALNISEKNFNSKTQLTPLKSHKVDGTV